MATASDLESHACTTGVQSLVEAPATEANVGQESTRTSMKDKITLAIVFTIFVTFRAMDRIFYYDYTRNLAKPTYNVVFTNLVWPAVMQIPTVLLLGIYILVQRCQGKRMSWRFFLPGNPAASSGGAVSLVKLAMFSFFDQMNAALSAPPGPFVRQPVQNVMNNSQIVWVVLLSLMLLRSRFQQVHYVGIVLVLMAVVIQLLPNIPGHCDKLHPEQTFKTCITAYKLDEEGGKYGMLDLGTMILWYSMFLISTLPNAGGSVYRQLVLQGGDVDVFYASFWSGLAQIVWGWLFLFTLWIPFPGSHAVAPSETFSVIADVMSCFVGNMPEGVSDKSCATPPPAAVWFMIYLVFNIVFNTTMMWLIKTMSSTWAQIGNVLCLNLCSIFSTSTALMGDNAQPMTKYDWYALVLTSVAMWVYNQGEETSKFSRDKKNKNMDSDDGMVLQ